MMITALKQYLDELKRERRALAERLRDTPETYQITREQIRAEIRTLAQVSAVLTVIIRETIVGVGEGDERSRSNTSVYSRKPRED